jgi:hypothetical protein
MADFVTLSCPSCGAGLEVAADARRVTCRLCGTELMPSRASGILSLERAPDDSKGVMTSAGGAAPETAMARPSSESKTSHLQPETMSARQATLRREQDHQAKVEPSRAAAGGCLGALAGLLRWILTQVESELGKGSTGTSRRS